jgi:hypothetical protein
VVDVAFRPGRFPRGDPSQEGTPHDHDHRPVPGGRTTSFDPTATSLGGLFLVQLSVAVLGALAMSGEYSTAAIRSTLAAVPRRLPVLWAKGAVLAMVTFVPRRLHPRRLRPRPDEPRRWSLAM